MMLSIDGISPSPENFKIAESGLQEQTEAALVLWSGRAASSLYHAFRLAMRRHPNIKSPEIIMPALSCTTSANVAAILGIKPRFADVDIHNALTNLNAIKRVYNDNTIAVVAIHLYGNAMPLDDVAQWAKENNLLLIEDPTQALGGKHSDGSYLGSKGDIAVFSLNQTKIIEIGNGVLTANHTEIAEELKTLLAEEETPFPTISDEERSQIALEYRNKHHGWAQDLRNNPQNIPTVSRGFLEMRPRLEPLYLRPTNAEINLNAAWEALGENLAHRLKLAHIYAEKLATRPDYWEIATELASGVVWRFTLFLKNPEQQVALSEAVRKDGFHVSNLYWAVNQYFNPEDECPNADYLARRVINLWLDASVDEAYVRACADSLVRHADALLK